MEFGTLISAVNTGGNLLSRILSKRGTRITKKITAVSLMQKAINNTELYLVNSNNNYQPNAKLSQLWLEAFTAMIPVDKELSRRLREKSRFWSNPQSWINKEGAMELIPTLRALNQRCEMLLIELDKR
jgi:hypothetical protein